VDDNGGSLLASELPAVYSYQGIAFSDAVSRADAVSGFSRRRQRLKPLVKNARVGTAKALP
jgi:hypothetical protein